MPDFNRRQLMTSTLGLSLAVVTGQTGAIDSSERKPIPDGPGRIFGPGPQGWWDSERVSCPRVLRNPAGGWLMWYYGRDPQFDREVTLPTGRVGLAESDDGINWRRVSGPLTQGSIFEPSDDLS